jgi:hypothetical protein
MKQTRDELKLETIRKLTAFNHSRKTLLKILKLISEE